MGELYSMFKATKSRVLCDIQIMYLLEEKQGSPSEKQVAACISVSHNVFVDKTTGGRQRL